MGFAHNGICHADESSYISAVLGEIDGQVVVLDGAPAVMRAEWDDWSVNVTAVQAGLAQQVGTYPVSYRECESEDPFRLSMEQGAQISVAIIAIWALAYGFRVLARMSKSDSEKEI